MPDNEPNRPRSRRWWIVAALPFLYVLSVGPFCWTLDFISKRSSFTEMLATVIYYPLVLVGAHVSWFNEFLRWYINLLR